MINQGKNVRLTNGERRLLIDVLEKEIGFLDGIGDPPLGSDGQLLEDNRVRKLRIRQYRRIILQLNIIFDGDETPNGKKLAEAV